MTAAHIKV